MDNKLQYIKKILGKWFLPPVRLNWGYVVLVLSIASGLCYLVRNIINDAGVGWSLTSLAGYSLLMPVLIFFSLIIPTAALARNSHDRITGQYSGVAPLILAFFSGVPVMLISRSCHNLIVMFWTSKRIDMVFPVYFYRTELNSWPYSLYQILIDTIIPSFGIALFFFGLLFSTFKKTDKVPAYFIIGILYAAYNLNLIDFISLAFAGSWLAFVRTKSRNIWGPILCMLGTRITELVFGDVFQIIDITTIQTYSDIELTYLYASLPAFLIGGILVFFFMKMFNDFYNSYSISLLGDVELPVEADDDDKNKPSFVKGINPALLVGTIIFIIIWVYVCKGVHL